MIRTIALAIIFFTIISIYSMEHISDEVLRKHRMIAEQGAQLINSEISANTADKWRSLLDQAHEFQNNNPKFPYRLLARRPGQGPDAQGIINAAPLIVDCLEKNNVTTEQLNKFKFSLGKSYISILTSNQSYLIIKQIIISIQ